MIYTVTLNPAIDRELTVPEIAYDKVLRASESRIDWGGKGFNVSRMLASLGTDSIALGFAGGKSGERLQDGLTSLGIGIDFVWVDEETRSNISIVTEAHDHYVKVNEAGPTISAAAQDTLMTKIRTLAQPGDWWVMAGSLPPGVPADFYAQIIEAVQAAGAFAVLDSSGEALQHACQAGPLMVKPNAVEAAKLSGIPVDSREDAARAAGAIHQLGVGNVVISLGGSGALLTDGQQTWFLSPPLVEERNPIGAGDSMVAGLVWGLSKGYTLPEAGRWGVACGAAAASQGGTRVGSYEMVESLVSQVAVSVL